MTRPARIKDAKLAERIQLYMQAEGLSMRELADMVAVDKSTLSRSLKAGAFSRQVRHSLRNAVDPIDARETVELLVHKALRLISISDRLRERADRMLIEALDQSSGSK